MSGFGSKASAWCGGPDLRLGGIALSERASTKSLTIKSRLENVSREKDGAEGKIERLACVEGACDIEELVLGGPGILLRIHVLDPGRVFHILIKPLDWKRRHGVALPAGYKLLLPECIYVPVRKVIRVKSG